jgi:cytidylate kinase
VGVVTISAPYGARGHEVGTAVAEQLGLILLDRAIPAAVARQLNISDQEAEDLDERAPSPWERLASAFADVGPIGAAAPGPESTQSPDDYRLATESVLLHTADTTGAVVLGRAGMVILRGRPDVLSVRLDGPAEARIAHMVAQGTDETTARQAQRDLDRTREAFARIFYNVHQDDPRLYHLILDTTALPVAICIEIIVTAAKARFAQVKVGIPVSPPPAVSS